MFAAEALELEVLAVEPELEPDPDPDPELGLAVLLVTVVLFEGLGRRKLKEVALPSPVEFKGVKPQFSSTVREIE